MIDDKRACAIERHAWKIYKGVKEPDIRILCPVKGGGWYCQWVAGHYGACVLGRGYRQRSYA